jgi:hypothetical protein
MLSETPFDPRDLVRMRSYDVTAQIAPEYPGRSIRGYYIGATRWKGVVHLAFESEVMVHLVERRYIVEVKEIQRRYEL